MDLKTALDRAFIFRLAADPSWPSTADGAAFGDALRQAKARERPIGPARTSAAPPLSRGPARPRAAGAGEGRRPTPRLPPSVSRAGRPTPPPARLFSVQAILDDGASAPARRPQSAVPPPPAGYAGNNHAPPQPPQPPSRSYSEPASYQAVRPTLPAAAGRAGGCWRPPGDRRRLSGRRRQLSSRRLCTPHPLPAPCISPA